VILKHNRGEKADVHALFCVENDIYEHTIVVWNVPVV
jgi:hypothetical protein